MKPKTKMYVANSAMTVGLLPYLAVLVYVALTSGYRGDAAMAAVFTIFFGLGAAYLIALVVSFPAFLWSRSLAQSVETDTRLSIFLRQAVVCGVFPLFAIFPLLVVMILR
jgi:hypothetical protein